MPKYGFLDGERIRKAHSVKRIEPILQRLAASNRLSPDGKKNPIVKVGADGIVGVELLLDEPTKVIQFYALTSSVRGCGRKMVEAVVGATPHDWHLAAPLDSSGGLWRKMMEEHPRLVVF
jgi:hypothetical protein